jgi:hypothetical protein
MTVGAGGTDASAPRARRDVRPAQALTVISSEQSELSQAWRGNLWRDGDAGRHAHVGARHRGRRRWRQRNARSARGHGAVCLTGRRDRRRSGGLAGVSTGVRGRRHHERGAIHAGARRPRGNRSAENTPRGLACDSRRCACAVRLTREEQENSDQQSPPAGGMRRKEPHHKPAHE